MPPTPYALTRKKKFVSFTLHLIFMVSLNRCEVISTFLFLAKKVMLMLAGWMKMIMILRVIISNADT